MNSQVQSSGAIAVTAGTAISTRPAFINAVTLTPAAAACTVTLYDSPSAASGTVLAVLAAAANGVSATLPVTCSIQCLRGIYAVVTGTGAQAVVYFGPQ